MKRSILLLTATIVLFSASQMSGQTVPNGKFSIRAGVGVVSTLAADATSINTPPLNISAGYQVTPVVNISGYAGYSSYTSESPFLVSDGQVSIVNNKQYVLALRTEVRKDLGGRFDVYGGAMLGYHNHSLREFDKFTNQPITRENNAPSPYDPNEPTGKVLYSGFIGTTYYLHSHIGVFAEIGYGVSLFNTGIAVNI